MESEAGSQSTTLNLLSAETQAWYVLSSNWRPDMIMESAWELSDGFSTNVLRSKNGHFVWMLQLAVGETRTKKHRFYLWLMLVFFNIFKVAGFRSVSFNFLHNNSVLLKVGFKSFQGRSKRVARSNASYPSVFNKIFIILKRFFVKRDLRNMALFTCLILIKFLVSNSDEINTAKPAVNLLSAYGSLVWIWVW